MLKLLRSGKAQGIVIHKIDRSARNLRDWADLGELIDQGIEVHFANESLDLNSRSGRLSADIQAVVAADYIRNLREEAKKGLYGRLKQGIYPFRAPLGYVDQGGGKVKTIHPEQGPLIRKTFELYASRKFTLIPLMEEMYRRGLRSVAGMKVNLSGIALILKNPFYTGLIRIKRTSQFFEGAHEPLISRQLFDEAQDVMAGRLSRRTIKHEFLFQKTVRCSCGYYLIAEKKKGFVYYRCHRNECPVMPFREERIQDAITAALDRLRFTPGEKARLLAKIRDMKANWIAAKEGQLNVLRVRQEKLAERLSRLTDGYLDNAIDKNLFEEKKSAILQERLELGQAVEKLQNGRPIPDELQRFVELAGTASLLYKRAIPEKKRRMVRFLSSNLTVRAGSLDFIYRKPFDLVANRNELSCGGPSSPSGRTLDEFVGLLAEELSVHPIPVE